MSRQKFSPLRWLGIALVVAIVLMATFSALSMTTTDGYYGMTGTGAWGWAVILMAVPVVILIIILLVALGALGDASTSGSPTRAPFTVTPLDVLDQRYARGELDHDEYLRMRTDLTRRPSNP